MDAEVGMTKSQQSSVSNLQSIEKDLSTAPENGGYGFEKIAKSLGYSTYTLSQDKHKTFLAILKQKRAES